MECPFGAIEMSQTECSFGVGECGIGKAIDPGLHSNPVKFDGIKPGVVDLLPEQPVADQVVGVDGFLAAGDVGQAHVILVVDAGQADFAGEHFDFFRHRLSRC